MMGRGPPPMAGGLDDRSRRAMTADGPRPFDTAFFWDIENLTRGYGHAEEAVATLSLAGIIADVRDAADIGRIAVNRAYANWSDRRLSGLRHELFDLGI